MLKKETVKMLRRIKRLMLKEPKRMAMGIWRMKREDYEGYDGDGMKWPRCGTIGCIGGWAEHLHMRDGNRFKGACEVLDLNIQQYQELCYDTALMGDPKQQTMAHARRVAKHIDDFIKRHHGEEMTR